MELDWLSISIGLLIGALIVYIWLHVRIVDRAEDIADRLFQAQRAQLEESIKETFRIRFEEWKSGALSDIVEEERREALDRSRAVLKGRIGEQMAPLMPSFTSRYRPAEARFLGSPIDYIVFHNIGNEEPLSIVFMDVKTGESTLTRRERRIKEAVEDNRVSFSVLRID
ncbi:MAG: Holliday junction resolvase-like protein [Candidatus Bathyarchaeia archaeon]